MKPASRRCNEVYQSSFCQKCESRCFELRSLRSPVKAVEIYDTKHSHIKEQECQQFREANLGKKCSVVMVC